MQTYNFYGFKLAFDAVETNEPISVAKMKRPSFHAGTKMYFYDFIAAATSVVHEKMGVMLFSRCGACGQLGATADMDIGHIVKWREYLENNNVRTKSAAIAAYNDINNLRLEHACCNRSHSFEDYTGDWPHPNGANLYADLISAIEESPALTAAEYVINDRDDLTLCLAEPIVKHRSAKPVDWEKFDRPGWDKSTRGGLLQVWKNAGKMQKAPIVENGRDLTWLQCGSCKNYGLAHDMHIGHKVNWETYLMGLDVRTNAEALWAYNDLNNLQFEHSKCNLGHEWEDYDSEDSEFNYNVSDPMDIDEEMRDFIVADPKEEESTWRETSGFDQYMRDSGHRSGDQLNVEPTLRRNRTVASNPENARRDGIYDESGVMPRSANGGQVQSAWHLGFPNQ